MALGIVLSPLSKAQSPVFEELKARFDSVTVFTANFEHTSIDSYTEETTTSSGLIWIDNVGYKLESGDQVIVVDGEISQVYNGVRNRLIVSEYFEDEDDFAPSRMLSGLDETYMATQEKKTSGHTLITLNTNDEFAVFLTIEIEVNEQLVPLKITTYDFAENVIITIFTNGVFEEKSEDMFKSDVPADAEIVDMRF